MITNFDKCKEIKGINTFAALISGRFSCTFCAYRGAKCESSYSDFSCINGISEFLQQEYSQEKFPIILK